MDAQLGGDTEVSYHTDICKMAAVTNVAMERHNLPEALSVRQAKHGFPDKVGQSWHLKDLPV